MSLLLLQLDACALWALRFSILVVDVPLEFFHRNFARLAGHVYASVLPGSHRWV